MRFSVICDDRTVMVDGDPRVVSQSVAMPSNVAAIQWFGKRGELEFKIDEYGRRPQNEEFFDLEPYQYLVDAHAAAKKRDEDAQRELAEKKKAAREKIEEGQREMAEAEAMHEKAIRLAQGQE